MAVDLIMMPIKACHKCWRAYDLDEWAELPLVERDGSLERRTCLGESIKCDEVLAFDMADAGELTIFVPASEYAEIYPGSSRVTQRVVRVGLWFRVRAFFQRVREYFAHAWRRSGA
jgi:hypothetical protein